MPKYLFLLLVLWSWSYGSFSQVISKKGKAPEFLVAPSSMAPDARQYVFTRFSTFNGLSSNVVNNIVQDRKGFIWMATPNGLQRYDGNKFITFKHQPTNSLSLPDDNVGHIHLDRKGKLWILTADNRIGMFDTDRFSYEEVTIRWSGARPTIFTPKAIVETREGKMLLGVSAYDTYEYQPGSNSFTLMTYTVSRPKGWKRQAVFYDTLAGRTWIACDSGLIVFDPATKHSSYRGHNLDNNPIIAKLENLKYVFHPFVANDGRFFVATWVPRDGGPRLHYFNPKTGEYKVYSISEELFGGGYHEINGITQQRNGRIWIYGLPFIAEFVGGKPAMQGLRNEFKDEQSIKFDVASNIFEDRTGNLWISTSNGVYLFNPDSQLFDAYHLLRPDGSGVVEGPTKCILEVDSNTLWVGCWGVGLYAYDKNFRPISLPASLKPYQQTSSIWCMQRQKQTGKIWMGLQDGAMLIYDPGTGKTEWQWFDAFEKRTIRQMIEDREGNLWFGTQGGLVVKWTYKSGQDIKQGFSLINRGALVHKLFLDNKGFIWEASMGQGLFKIDPVNNRVIERYRAKGEKGRRLWNDSPSDIVQTDDSTLVIACNGVSVLNTNTGAIKLITTDDGLPSNNVMCLQKDERGVCWLGMITGLCRMNMEQMIFTYYDRRDGLPADYFEVDDAHQLKDGRLLFTSAHNFVVFDPQKMVSTQRPSTAAFTDIRLANVSLPIDSVMRLYALHLDHDKSSISIEFGGFNYIRQNKVEYYYQLVGVDKDYVHADDRRQAVYNHLSPGSYVFNVKSINADGVNSEKITSLRISVLPPFYRTWWFYGLLILVLIAILYWIDKLRMKRLRDLQAMRTQIAGNLHEEINTTLNNINMLSEMAKIKADKDLNRSKEYIDQISEKSHNMIIAMDDMVWSIDPQNDSMEKTLLRMLEFVDALINRHGANIDIVVDEKIRLLELDMKSRHEMLLIFKEVLRNMAQDTTDKHILINIDLMKSKLSLKIQDNGNYSSEADLFSPTALNMMSRRTANIQAELDIQADKSGVSVILLVPVSKST